MSPGSHISETLIPLRYAYLRARSSLKEFRFLDVLYLPDLMGGFWLIVALRRENDLRSPLEESVLCESVRPVHSVQSFIVPIVLEDRAMILLASTKYALICCLSAVRGSGVHVTCFDCHHYPL